MALKILLIFFPKEIERFIHVGSSSEYDQRRHLIKKMQVQPLSKYGKNKLKTLYTLKCFKKKLFQELSLEFSGIRKNQT